MLGEQNWRREGFLGCGLSSDEERVGRGEKKRREEIRVALGDLRSKAVADVSKGQVKV